MRELLSPGRRPSRMTAATVATGPTLTGPEPKRYRVTVGFRHPTDGVTLTDRQLDSLPEGDSGLRMTNELSLVFGSSGSEEIKIRLTRNAAGRLARAQVHELAAPSMRDARSTVAPLIGVVLSRMAFEHGALVAQHWIEVVEIESGRRELGFVFRGPDVAIEDWSADWFVMPSPFFRAAFAVYREAVLSTNPYYALICFQRVIDGARHFRGLQSKYAKAQGHDARRAKLLLEAEEGIFGPTAELIGETLDRVADYLYQNYRIAAAHGVRADEPLLAADQLQIENRYWAVLGAARQVARRMLHAEHEFRRSLSSDPIPELDEATFA